MRNEEIRSDEREYWVGGMEREWTSEVLHKKGVKERREGGRER